MNENYYLEVVSITINVLFGVLVFTQTVICLSGKCKQKVLADFTYLSIRIHEDTVQMV